MGVGANYDTDSWIWDSWICFWEWVGCEVGLWVCYEIYLIWDFFYLR